jgi:hypothetical protein
LTRSYESNGPDVKIRGNAHHVAEKYLQLARDAHTGGDPVAAENYLQHAEHYFRLIASAQAAQALAQSGQPRPPGEGEIDDMEEDGDFGTLSDRFASPAERQIAYQQPQQGFQPHLPFRSRMWRRPRRNPMPSGLPTTATARARTIGRDLQTGRIVRATAFLNAARDKIGRSRTGMKAIATTGRGATAVREISGRTAIPSPNPRGTSAPKAPCSRSFRRS